MRKRLLSIALMLVFITTLASPSYTIARENYTTEGSNPGNTGKQYTISTIQATSRTPASGSTAMNWMSNSSSVSPVSQFLDENEEFAYAYFTEDSVIVVASERFIVIPKEHPLVGAVTMDEDGNIYVVYGRENTIDNSDIYTPTVFISKYTGKGELIKTIGFSGTVGSNDSFNTMIPFRSGNCDVAINNGVLMCSYARRMYSGHQMKDVIAVRTENMSSIISPRTTRPWVGHSFDQRVIWSEKLGEFLFFDQGDAGPRGFVVQTLEKNLAVFNFYLSPEAGDNMFIVNRTFAQLGGIVETSAGIALVGASAMSISANAEYEMQNLFIQIFDSAVLNQNATMLSESYFITSGTRRGTTTDYFSQTTASVVDYGIKWLTDYTDQCVYAPQVVKTDDDRLIVLWEVHISPYTINPVDFRSGGAAWYSDSFYMILSAQGEVLQDATSLDGIRLNAHEDPIYENGSVFWVTLDDGILTKHELVIIDHPEKWALFETDMSVELGLASDSLQKAGWKLPATRLIAADAIVATLEVALGKTMQQIAAANEWDLSRNGFSDTNSQSATFLKYAGITNGVGDNRYDPDSSLTRGQMVTMIGRCAEEFFGRSMRGTNSFSDVPDWAAPYVAYAAANGITDGVGGGLFNPNGVLQNQHTAVFCYRAYNVWE